MGIEEIAKMLDERFGGTDLVIHDGAEIYFRARKEDDQGRSPAVLALRFTYRSGKWWLRNEDLSLPIWETVRKCGVENY